MDNNYFPQITIITTSYNYAEYISQTIESVLAQTFSNWELIIVDDASSDNSVEVIKKYCDDKRIKLICHDKNKGLRASIKTALKYAKGEWVAFVESDDTITSDALEKRLKTFFVYDIILKASCSQLIIINGENAMAITFDEKRGMFYLESKNTSYVMKVNMFGFVSNMY